MKKLLPFALLFSLAFAGCGKEDVKPEEEKPATEVTFESGDGGLFIGSVRDKELFNYRITTSDRSTVKTGMGAGRKDNKALNANCEFTSANAGQFAKLPAGKYIIFITLHSDPENVKRIDVEIAAGKCASVEANGLAW